jgi:hypothetical protein
VSELQALVTSWLTELAAVLPFGFAFGVGMVAAVNPCGFAMLPAYLSLYLGAHEEDFRKRPPTTRLLQALLVSVRRRGGGRVASSVGRLPALRSRGHVGRRGAPAYQLGLHSLRGSERA